jgi:hypothetical protein
MSKRRKNVNAEDKRALGEILFEANQSMERQIDNIKKDVASFTDFIADLKKGSIDTDPAITQKSYKKGL